ncbi:MAG: zinc-dependent alcohol dehydrogenase family protein [Proteobacteria bacterium]|nr:zinc-dependent alcohol dehydrogenase family protein [Pseudomonadota bacterium]
MPETIRIVQLTAVGSPVAVLKIVDTLRPLPGPGEVGIRVHAFALNRADWLYAHGWHYTAPVIPSRIGSECAGVVEALGLGVGSVQVGDRVCTIPFDTARHGVQGDYAVVPARYLAPWPEGLSAIQAAATWMQYLTAYYALVEIAAVGPKDHVLMPAASSSAGLGAVQLASLTGARVIGTTRSQAKVTPIIAAGAAQVIVVDDHTDLAGQIMQATGGRGVRVVYDPIAGPFMRRYLGALAPHARIFIYGLLSGAPTELDIVPLVRSAAVVHPYSLFNHVRDQAELKRGVDHVLDAVQRQGLRPMIGRVFPFSQTLDAYRELDRDSHFGKIVVDLQHG